MRTRGEVGGLGSADAEPIYYGGRVLYANSVGDGRAR